MPETILRAKSLTSIPISIAEFYQDNSQLDWVTGLGVDMPVYYGKE